MKDTNTKYILDASFLASYLLPDEFNPKVNSYFERYISNLIVFLAPSIVDYEVLNIIRSAIVSGRLRKEHKETLVNLYQDLSIQTIPIDYAAVLETSLEYSISAYDASYLWLSFQLNVPLLTLDDRLSSCGKMKK